jgi:hypothetical protein
MFKNDVPPRREREQKECHQLATGLILFASQFDAFVNKSHQIALTINILVVVDNPTNKKAHQYIDLRQEQTKLYTP